MKSVGGGVNSDKAQSAVHRIQQGLLAGWRHGWIPVRPGLGQIQSRKEEHRGILFSEIRRIEDAAIFGGSDFKAMLLCQGLDRLFEDAGVSVSDLDHFVFKA